MLSKAQAQCSFITFSMSFIQLDAVDDLKEFIDKIDDKQKDDDEYHDAVADDNSDDTNLDGKFEDALTLNETIEEELTDEETAERKEKSDKLKYAGNNAFKAADYSKSIELYTEALEICPKSCKIERSILYANRGAGYMHQDAKDLALQDCTKSLELNENYMKALVRRAKLYEDTDKLDESLADYNRILELDADNAEARAVIPRLNQKIEERNEKLKTEMLGKLKDLGNMILRPFGLSTNNFQMQQDPSTGSYSVNFAQNPGNS
jgi:tetratricopeptide (TPR) repeat protein